MTAVVILYGSRARGDAHEKSDVDLILSQPIGEPDPPKTLQGMSLHFYSQDWLLSRVSTGDLFAAHVALEGRGLYDPDDFMGRLKKSLSLKATYRSERKLAIAALTLLTSKDWEQDFEIRRRYFWAVRTLGAALSAEEGKPSFSNVEIEAAIGVTGLANHIAERESRSYEECVIFTRHILERHGAKWQLSPYLAEQFLMESNIGRSTVQLFEMAEVSEFAATAIYS